MNHTISRDKLLGQPLAEVIYCFPAWKMLLPEHQNFQAGSSLASGWCRRTSGRCHGNMLAACPGRFCACQRLTARMPCLTRCRWLPHTPRLQVVLAVRLSKVLGSARQSPRCTTAADGRAGDKIYHKSTTGRTARCASCWPR